MGRFVTNVLNDQKYYTMYMLSLQNSFAHGYTLLKVPHCSEGHWKNESGAEIA